ncbi:MAG: hypothetical protein Q9162_004737 [Coniocarpon cinnabarinum]
MSGPVDSQSSPAVVAVTINPLLKQLDRFVEQSPDDIDDVPRDLVQEIALAVSQVFTKEISPIQTAILLHDLHLTGLDRHPDVLKECAKVMIDAAYLPDEKKLQHAVHSRKLNHGKYRGGLCDIVGTGGDGHSTFNISTASSILASSLLLVAKHGNRASTSRSGSSEVLACMQAPNHPQLDRITPETLPDLYSSSNYGFLFAPTFHKGLGHISGTRKELPHPSIFNLLGPLTNPANSAMEARVIGVKNKDLVPVFAQALKMNGVKKALVICGDEDLDEISIAGPTHCAWLTDHDEETHHREMGIQYFKLAPEDFGLKRIPLTDVGPGKTPKDNAEIMHLLLTNGMPAEDPVLQFVLMNTAALFVVSGICNDSSSAFGDNKDVILEHGPAGGRWREGVRLARQAVESGKAWEMLQKYTEYTNKL